MVHLLFVFVLLNIFQYPRVETKPIKMRDKILYFMCVLAVNLKDIWSKIIERKKSKLEHTFDTVFW